LPANRTADHATSVFSDCVAYKYPDESAVHSTNDLAVRTAIE
jgi:hypothetical protein